MFRLNLKIALRNLWKNKGFSLINIGGLAIGLACCLLLLLYVNYEWSYDKQYKNIDNIYFSRLNLKFNGKVATTYAVPLNLANAVMQEIPGVKNAARMMEMNENLFSRNQNKFKLNATYVDPSFIKILSYDFIYGNAANSLNEPNAVILTETVAKKLFGNENPIGQAVKWDNQKDLKVTAVIADLPKNQGIQFDVLQPWAFYEQLNPSTKESGWGNIVCRSIFELKENASLAAVNASLLNFIPNKESDLKSYLYQVFLFPIGKTHLYDKFENGKQVGGKIDQVKLFAFLALCVLFIACINYMNLSTARSEKRAREVGVRKALGSGRSLLMWQFMLESLLLSFLAMFVAFALLELSLPYFNNLLDLHIQVDYGSYLFWIVLTSLALLTGLLAGSYPSFYLSSFIPIKVLKGFKGSVGTLSIRKVLVVVQFSLSVCMIISAIVIYNQIQFLKNKPLGFEQNGMAQIDLEGELKNPSRLQLFKDELKKNNAIISATEFAGPFTGYGSVTSGISWPGKAADDKSIMNYRSTGFDFVHTIGAKLVAGRDFSPRFASDTSTAVMLNESAVKRMNLKNPVGTMLTWNDNHSLKVIGVVKDYFNEELGKEVTPTLYYYNINESKVLLLRLNPNQPLNVSVQAIKQVSEKLNPNYPAAIKFVAEGMKEKLSNERLLSVLSNLFGGFAIFISCLGLLGLALYMAEQRSKEISIRKVLGAGLSDILVLLNKDFMKLVLIANAIAVPIAYILLAQWLQKYDYKTALGFWPFALAIFASVFIAVVTVSLQLFKVAKANAVQALKYE